jgi:hypothetical protein
MKNLFSPISAEVLSARAGVVSNAPGTRPRGGKEVLGFWFLVPKGGGRNWGKVLKDLKWVLLGGGGKCGSPKAW